MTARWPARVALAAALAAPLLATTAPAEAASRKPFPACQAGQSQYAPMPGRAWIPEGQPQLVHVCRHLRRLAVVR
jgi:hypothetical protein